MAYSNEKTTSGATSFLVFIILIAMVYPAAWFGGWVLLTLYNWFLASVAGAPVLTLGNMIGLDLILTTMVVSPLAIRLKSAAKTTDPIELLSQAIVQMFFPSLLSLGLGYLYHIWFI